MKIYLNKSSWHLSKLGSTREQSGGRNLHAGSSFGKRCWDQQLWECPDWAEEKGRRWRSPNRGLSWSPGRSGSRTVPKTLPQIEATGTAYSTPTEKVIVCRLPREGGLVFLGDAALFCPKQTSGGNTQLFQPSTIKFPRSWGGKRSLFPNEGLYKLHNRISTMTPS